MKQINITQQKLNLTTGNLIRKDYQYEWYGIIQTLRARTRFEISIIQSAIRQQIYKNLNYEKY